METASICIAIWDMQHYLQVITAINTNRYFIPISGNAAALLMSCDDIPIYTDIEITEDMITV